MMAAFHGSLETSHCLLHRNPLPKLAPPLRSPAVACSKSSECGLAWPRRSETPSPPASFERPATSQSFYPMRGCFSQFGSLGGLYAFSGASSMAELGAAIPRSGGQYNFSRRALGDYAGFIVGWSDWLSSCGTLGAVAIVIGEYSGE